MLFEMLNHSYALKTNFNVIMNNLIIQKCNLFQNKYNVVVSAFSMFELPTMEDRINTLRNLWNKTEDFLVILLFS